MSAWWSRPFWRRPGCAEEAGRSPSKALILMYHRVAEGLSDPWSLCVSPGHFAEHMEVLRREAIPCRLQDLAARLQKRRIPDRAVAVTFDDGYADNYETAKPLLERYAVPATVFVSSGYIGQEREFWWDELEGICLRPGRLPRRLELSIDGQRHQWDLGEAASYDEDLAKRDRGWKEQDAPPTARQALYRSVWQLLQALSDQERRRRLDELLAWAGCRPFCRPTHRTLTADQVLALARGGLVEIGAHSVTHPMLSKCSVETQRAELTASKTRLETILGQRVASLAYPFGDYTSESVALAREASYACACSTVARPVALGDDPFQLPRVMVEDWSRETFAERMHAWLER